MRVLVCDDHVLFAESLAHLLGSLGRTVVAVTHHPDPALAVLRERPVDACLLDVAFGTESVLARIPQFWLAAPGCRLVLLSGQVDQELLAAARAAGVHGVADKRQPISEILSILDRVRDGSRHLPATTHWPQPAPARPVTSDAQWLAGFLTPREREVLGALVCGSGTSVLARRLGIAEATARCHVQSVLTKMGAHSRLEAATTAVRHGLVDPETGAWLVGAIGGTR